MNPSELERFIAAMKHVRVELSVQDRDLTPRDLHLLQAGMRAIFLVEAQAHGDDARADKHTRALERLLQAGASISEKIATAKAAND